MEPLFASETMLEKLVVRNVTWEFGWSFLKDLETNKSIKKVVIQFNRFVPVKKAHQVTFTEGANTRLQSLKLCFHRYDAA